jgi:hypothetical protein
MKVVLIGMWLMQHHPPVPFQVDFNSIASCRNALDQLSKQAPTEGPQKGRLVAVCAER